MGSNGVTSVWPDSVAQLIVAFLGLSAVNSFSLKVDAGHFSLTSSLRGGW